MCVVACMALHWIPYAGFMPHSHRTGCDLRL
ncbi:hypothetical protein SAMN05216284_114116 [Micromonospora sediminimaris]|nr:hypothetical protein SAMN05216284_114116 [Micromonospora sediminimaris]